MASLDLVYITGQYLADTLFYTNYLFTKSFLYIYINFLFNYCSDFVLF